MKLFGLDFSLGMDWKMNLFLLLLLLLLLLFLLCCFFLAFRCIWISCFFCRDGHQTILEAWPLVFSGILQAFPSRWTQVLQLSKLQLRLHTAFPVSISSG